MPQIQGQQPQVIYLGPHWLIEPKLDALVKPLKLQIGKVECAASPDQFWLLERPRGWVCTVHSTV